MKTFYFSIIVIVGITIPSGFLVYYLILPSGFIDNGCYTLQVEHLSDYELNTIRQNNKNTQLEFLQITDTDLQNMPKLKQIIDVVKDHVYFNNDGTNNPLGFNHTTLPGDSWNKYLTWFEEKFENQYGVKQDTSYYFHYGRKNYTTLFSHC